MTGIANSLQFAVKQMLASKENDHVHRITIHYGPYFAICVQFAMAFSKNEFNLIVRVTLLGKSLLITNYFYFPVFIFRPPADDKL